MNYLDFMYSQHTPDYWDLHWEEAIDIKEKYIRDQEYRIYDYYCMEGVC